MDLSRFKWPAIIVLIVGAVWLMGDGGTRYMYGRLLNYAPGTDPGQDKVNEAGLTRLGGFLYRTLRYDRAGRVFRESINRYGAQGENYWINVYRLARCREKGGDYGEAARLIQELLEYRAYERDKRVPDASMLRNRQQQLVQIDDYGRT